MTTIGERIALIIQKNNLKKVQFAEKLGISGAYVTHLVKGKNDPSDALVKLICREFHIRQEWLLTGEGPMEDSEPMTPLTEYAKERNMTPFEERMIHAWFDLPLDTRQMLMEHFRMRLLGGKDLLDGLNVYNEQSPVISTMAPAMKAESAQKPNETPLSEEEIQRELAEYEALLRGTQRLQRQFDVEKRLFGSDSSDFAKPDSSGKLLNSENAR